GRHPYIVETFGAQEIEERLCLFLEYVGGDIRHGVDLSGWIGTRDLTLKRALAFAWQIALAMRHASETFERLGQVFVHRDLKPPNILVASADHVKVTDF